MALTKCSECGKDFSDKAAACPNCGNPTPTDDSVELPAQTPPKTTLKKNSGCAKFLTAIGCVFWLLVGIGLIANKLLPDEDASPAASTETTPAISGTAPEVEKPTAIEDNKAQATASPLKTLNFTIDDVIANYNRIAPVLKCAPLSRSGAQRTEGPAAASTILSSEYSSLVLQSPLSSDQVSGAMYIGIGDGTERSGLLVILSAVCFVTAMTPELDGESRGQALLELGLAPVAITDGREREWRGWGIRLTSMFSDVTGLNVTADTVE